MEGEELWVLLSLWRFFYALVFEIGVVAICFNGNKKSEEKKIVVVVVEIHGKLTRVTQSGLI